MKILIDITPELNKWFPTEKEFVKGFRDELKRNLYTGNIGGIINSCELINDDDCDDDSPYQTQRFKVHKSLDLTLEAVNKLVTNLNLLVHERREYTELYKDLLIIKSKV